MNKKVSVLMSVYNGYEHLRDSIESILNQTFDDFEFLIINDGSTERGISELILSYNDPRIVYFDLGKNLGLAKALNYLLQNATGEYLIRMDADDIAELNRFELQVSFLDENTSIDIVAGGVKRFGKVNTTWIPHTADDKIKTTFLWDCAIAHPSVAIRRKSLQKHDLNYDESLKYAQDYDLWTRCVIKGLTFAAIDKVLLNYRVPEKLSIMKVKLQQETHMNSGIEYLSQISKSYVNTAQYLIFNGHIRNIGEFIDWCSVTRKIWLDSTVPLHYDLFISMALSKLNENYKGSGKYFIISFLRRFAHHIYK